MSQCCVSAGLGVGSLSCLVLHGAVRLPLRADGVGEPGDTCGG
jgi:hypothetical protein